MRWQWHQLDHMQIICTLLHTDNHASTSTTQFLQIGCLSCHPTNSIKALKVQMRSNNDNYQKLPRSINTNCCCCCYYYYYNHFMALWTLSGTTQVSQYQKKHSPTHTYHGHQSSLICFLHLLRSTASSLFNLRAWQSFSTLSPSFLWSTSWLAASTSYSVHFFTQSLFSVRSTCPYHRNLFCCSTEIISPNPSLSLKVYKHWLVKKLNTAEHVLQ